MSASVSVVDEINPFVQRRLRAAEKKAQVRIRRRRMTSPPAAVKAAADAAARKELAKELSQEIRKFCGREEIPAVLSSIQDAARINTDAMSRKPLLPAWVVFADGSRAERRKGKVEVRTALREHFLGIVEDAEELNRYFDDDYDEYFDLHEDEILAPPDGYPDEGPCEFYEGGHCLDF